MWPITFRLARNGLRAYKFWAYKLRSLKTHNKTDNNVTQAQKVDAPITKVEAFLRNTSLDELAQIFNVWLRDKSVTSPRSHALAHNEHYQDQAELYMWCDIVKSGIAGWARVNGFKGETDTIDKMVKRADYDL